MNGTTGNSARFAHYFAVCGLDCEQGLEPESAAGENLEQSPLHRSFKSNVLVHFPENSERCPFNKNAVNMLCFPRGLSFRSAAHRADSQFHSFTMVQDDGSRLYGFVLTFFEEVSSPAVLTAMTTLFQMHAAERQAGHAPSAPDSAASASDSSPSSSSMDSLLSSLDESDADSVGGASSPAVALPSFDVVRDGLFVSKALCLLTPLPFLSAARHFLVQLHRGVASGSAPPLPVESYIHNVLYEVPLPPPGRTLRFHGLREPIICQRPASSELPVGEFPLEEVFTQLGVELVVKLMSCVLLETQVLLYSQDLQMLTSVAESLSSLLFPFQWQHIYLPITSAPVCHLLDAPVPFILGLQRREGGDRASLHLPHESNLCFVDIDHHRLELPEDLPCFPDQSELVQELSEVLLRFGLSPQGGAVSPPHRAPSPPHHAPPSPRLTRLLLKDLMEDRTNGNLDRDQIQVLEKLQASEGAKMAAAGAKTAARAEEDADVRAAMLNIQIREVFAARFSAMFGKYEQFVINGSFDLDSWIRDREGSCNFDKGSFLSVQPSSHLLFMSRFLETSMFSSFVDSKVISRWAEPEPLQQLFDARVQKQRSCEDEEEEAQAGGGGRYRRCSSLSQSAQSVERRLKKVDHTAIHPHLLNMKIGQGRHEPGRFPKLQSDVLQQGLNTRRCGVTASRKTDFRRSCEISGPELDQSQKHIFLRKNLAHSKLLDLSPRSIAQTHREFVDGLLNECRLKTKRLLMERMGKESLELGQGEANITGLQEDTLILGLCDLIERTWGHGLHIKQGRSALWSHLLHYQASQRRSEADPAGSEQRVFADLPLHLRSSVLQDMSFIQTMGEGLSEVGQARAWIHLALEKKILSQHLKELLSNQELLRQLYKAHAFLLCEEEREQFLFHLLSLNTIDFLCFTRVFTSISIPYRVAIIPMKKLSIAMATVNPWVCVSGELGDSGLRQFPKNNQEITFQCKNLGRLSTLQLGQDSSGLLAKCLIDCVMVYNEITGHTYRFPCGRWLGKGVGDGSLERVLIAQLVSPAAEEDSGRFSGSPSPSGRWSGTPPPPELCSPSQSVMNVLGQLGSQKRVQAVEVQEDLREAANNLVKFFHKPEQERGNLTALLCGDGGLVRALEKFLLHGLKNSRLFQRNVFVWDFIEKAVVSMETGDGAGSPGVRGQPWESLSHYVNAINASQRNIGKEGKFQLFVCLGTRDQLLALWLPLLADCPLTARTYDDSALLRDSSAVQALNRILHTIYGFRISLEASLVKGIQL